MTMYVITHKEYDYLKPEGYIPLLVGADFNKNTANYLQDNIGDNISSKNKYFCELTGIYWLDKNLEAKENIGISHYRRYFYDPNVKGIKLLKKRVFGQMVPLDIESLNDLLVNHDWVVPQKVSFKQTVYDYYARYNQKKDMDLVRDAIQKLSPEFITAFDKVMSGNCSYLYNMFYTTNDNYHKYCSWLFKILFEVEQHVDMTGYTPYQQRVYGFLSERLLTVWLEKNSNLSTVEIPVFQSDLTIRSELFESIKRPIRDIVKPGHKR